MAALKWGLRHSLQFAHNCLQFAHNRLQFAHNRLQSLSFFSLVFLFAWYFSCWGFPWSFGVNFSAHFPGFLRVSGDFLGLLRCFLLIRKFLGVSEVFLGVFEKTKEKKDRDCAHLSRFVAFLALFKGIFVAR